MDKAISASYCLSIESCMKQFGVGNFLTQFDKPVSFYHEPHAYINVNELEVMIEKAMFQSNCLHFGLVLGKSLSISTHGFLGYAVMSSPDFITAISTMLKYITIRAPILTISYHQNDDPTSYIQIEVNAVSSLLKQVFTEMVFAHIVQLHQFLLNAPAPLRGIEFSFAKPEYVSLYQQFYGGAPSFEGSFNRLYIEQDDLTKPIAHADSLSFELAKQQLQKLVEEANQQTDFPSKLKALMLGSELHSLTMEAIAQELFMSSRTLRRRLEKQGLCFQHLLNEVRQQKAEQYLKDSSLSITEISFLLGFKDSSNFSRAFKRWTGKSPSDARS